MRKTLIAAAVVAAAAVGYYSYQQRSPLLDEPELAYVPADTVFFSGQFKTIDLISYLSSVGISHDYLANEELQQGLLILEEQLPAAGKFGLALFSGFINALESAEHFEATTGLSSQSRSFFYMVGAAPVMRLSLSDPTQFARFISELAQQSGFAHSEETINGHSYQRYQLADEQLPISLLVSTDRGWATIALHHSSLSESHLLQTLAQQTPQANLINSTTLTDYITRYQLNTDAIGYISNQHLAKALTSVSGNQLASDLQVIFGSALPDTLQQWQTPACQNDFQQLSQIWPGMVMDSQIIAQRPGHFQVKGTMRIPSHSATAVEGLQGLQGFIPSNLHGKLPSSMFYVAAGIDIGQLTPAISKLWAGATDYPLTCEPLQALQETMRAQNPLLLLAMAGVAANGLQGVSVTINDFDLDMAAGMPTNADALISLSAVNPQNLLNALTALNPMFAGLTLPAPGEDVALSTLLPMAEMLGLDLRLQTTSNHVMIYVGDQAKQQAASLARDALKKNGMLAFGVNYQQFFTRLTELSMASGQEVPADLQRLMHNTMQMGMSLSVDQHGIVFHTELQTGTK